MNANLQLLLLGICLVSLGACQTASIDNSDYGLDRNEDLLEVAAELERRNLVLGETGRLRSGARISDWHRINDTYLILSTSFTRRYLITLTAPCRGLSSARNIAMEISGTALSAGDWILPRTTINPPIRCRIAEITALVEPPSQDDPDE